MFINRIIDSLERGRVQYAIAGGWAVALHGAVRGTVDLDIVIALTGENIAQAEKALQRIGLESRLPIGARDILLYRKEYIQNRNMKAWRFVKPSDPTEIVDILIIDDLRKLKTTFIPIGSRKIPVVSISDLIRMKRVAGRAQDIEDIKALELLRK